MQRGLGSTHLKVSAETHAMLKELKKETKAKSVDAVIHELLSRPIGGAAQDGGSGSEPEARPEAANKRKKNVRDALYSFEILLDRPEMLEFYTGFDKGQVERLIKWLTEVKRAFCFFFFFCPSCSDTLDSICDTILTIFDRQVTRKLLTSAGLAVGLGSWTWPKGC